MLACEWSWMQVVRPWTLTGVVLTTAADETSVCQKMVFVQLAHRDGHGVFVSIDVAATGLSERSRGYFIYKCRVHPMPCIY